MISLTYAYIGAMTYIQSVIYAFNYKITCNYEAIHVRKQIFDHFAW